MINVTRSSNAKRFLSVFRPALAVSGVLFLSSCQIPDLCGPEPGRCMPSDFNGTSTLQSSALVGFEEFFDDSTLTRLICEGLNGNQELKILWQEVQIANNEVTKRRGAIFPFVTLGTRAGLEKSSTFTRAGAVDSQLNLSGHPFPDPLPDFLVAANVTWEVDIWRALRNARDAATLRYLGTMEGRNYVVTRLVAEIAENYYALIALDKRLETLDATIALQEQSLEVAEAKKAAAQGTELGVQRFTAEVEKNRSEKLIVRQEIIEVENRINFLLGRFPQPVERPSVDFIELSLNSLQVGVPSQLLLNRPDIRKAERELAAAGLDVQVARARFYPTLTLTGGVGYDAFNPKYLFMTPDALIANLAGDLVAPLINKSAIKADYQTANAVQLEAIYNYQRTILNAFTEVINRVSMVENYTQSIEIKKRQLEALELSVEKASSLFQFAEAEYIEVLFAQRDLMDARMVLIETKRQQLSAIINAYQALGGGLFQYSCYGTVVEPSELDEALPESEVPPAPEMPELPEEEPTPAPPEPEESQEE